jgi:hypothetical protein
MKWTAWEVIRLLLVVIISLASGLLLFEASYGVVLKIEGIFRTHSDNGVLQVIGLAFGVALVIFVVREQLVMLLMMIKGYSAKQMLFGDSPHLMLRAEENWAKHKRKWRRFFG